MPFRKKSVIPPGVSGTKDSKESDIEVDMEDDSLDSLVRQNNDSHSRNLEDDLDRIEKAASSPTSSIVDATERGKLKLTLMKDYDQHHISRSSSGSSIPMKTSHSKVGIFMVIGQVLFLLRHSSFTLGKFGWTGGVSEVVHLQKTFYSILEDQEQTCIKQSSLPISHVTNDEKTSLMAFQ